MYCKDFLKILATNPTKELRFVVAIPPNYTGQFYDNIYVNGKVKLLENDNNTITLFLDGRN